ncbi:sugar porter family MFS transporter [Streptomyces sp. NPDC088194]|uniref:sugar porter family MFS transporter n=1 Tax=Streptomyces sp. NPDC088194 TaxID=3154931 RepID=UPI00344D011B
MGRMDTGSGRGAGSGNARGNGRGGGSGSGTGRGTGSGGGTALSAPPARSAVLAVGLAGSAVGLIYGYDTGALAGALLSLKRDFGLSTHMQETVTSAVGAGSVIGAVLAKSACDRLGRRRTMYAVCIGYVVFSALSGLAPDLATLLVARLLLGVAIGGSVVAAPVFVGESSPLHLRGRLLVCYQLATTVGIAASYFADLGLANGGQNDWRWMLGISALPAAVVTILVARLPETGHWYLMHGRAEEAAVSLARTRGAEEVPAELERIRASLAAGKPGTVRELLRPPYRRAGLFVVGLGFFVQVTGIAAIVAYSPLIYKKVGFTSDHAAIMVTAMVQLAAMLGEVLALVLVERAGRRPTLLTGITLMAVANAVLIAAFAWGVGRGATEVIAVTGVVLFRIGYSAGFGAMVWVYASEALPARLRSTGASLLLTVDLLTNLIITLTFLSLLTSLGGVTAFGLFLALCLAAAVFALRFAPETRGRTLDEVEGFWKRGGRWQAD